MCHTQSLPRWRSIIISTLHITLWSLNIEFVSHFTNESKIHPTLVLIFNQCLKLYLIEFGFHFHSCIKNPSPLQSNAHRQNRLLRASLYFCCTLLVAERRLLSGAEASRSTHLPGCFFCHTFCTHRSIVNSTSLTFCKGFSRFNLNPNPKQKALSPHLFSLNNPATERSRSVPEIVCYFFNCDKNPLIKFSIFARCSKN